MIRTLICLYVLPAPISTVAGVQSVVIGIGVASQEAFAAGVVADPQTDLDFPQGGWVYRCRHAVIDDSTPGYPTPVIKEDLRSMRKIHRGELFMTVENLAAEGTTFSIRYVGIVRSLIKLP